MHFHDACNWSKTLWRKSELFIYFPPQKSPLALLKHNYAPIIWNLRTPPFRLERGIHFLCKWKWAKSPVPGDKSEWCIPPPPNLLLPSVTHWLKNTVGSHEINRFIFERPANNPVGDAKTVSSSEFPAYWGTKMKCIWVESPRNPPLRPEWGGMGGGGCGGFKWLVHYRVELNHPRTNK